MDRYIESIIMQRMAIAANVSTLLTAAQRVSNDELRSKFEREVLIKPHPEHRPPQKK